MPKPFANKTGEAFAADPFVERILGPDLRQEFITSKSEKWHQYHQSISQWEIDRYTRLFSPARNLKLPTAGNFITK